MKLLNENVTNNDDNWCRTPRLLSIYKSRGEFQFAGNARYFISQAQLKRGNKTCCFLSVNIAEMFRNYSTTTINIPVLFHVRLLDRCLSPDWFRRLWHFCNFSISANSGLSILVINKKHIYCLWFIIG